MRSPKSTRTDRERRTCDRVLLNYAVGLDTAEGARIRDTTRDISLSGLSIRSQNDLAQIRPGELAHFMLLLDDGMRSEPFPCVVNRIRGDLVGLALDKKSAAAFGKRLTKGMFRR